MTRTRSGVWLFASLLAAGMLFGVSLPAGAADAPAAQPADAVKAAQNLSQDQIQQIDQAVVAVANSMGDGSNPAAQSADRLWFASATKDSLGTPGSQQYLHTLALSANSHLLGVVKASDANFRAKIEAGLAAAALAGASHDTELAPLATALMQDSSAAIVLVGVKAAAVQVPYILSKNNPAQQDVFLLAQMEQTVVQQPKPPEGGEIAVAVYDAMSNSIFGPVRANAAQISNLLVPIVLKLEGDRLPFYGQGAVAEPRADATGCVILLDLWNSLNQGQQKAAIDAAVKGISATGKLAETAQDKTVLQGLVAALQTDGKELKLYADPNNGAVPDQELYDAAIKLANLFPGSQPATISADAQAAASALAKH